jgi:hypothetical protein
VAGHVHGISFSGKRGHFSVGPRAARAALASAAGGLPSVLRRAIRTLAVGLSLTRVLVLAHWASDPAAGFVLEAILERTLRLWTGYPLRRPASTWLPSKFEESANDRIRRPLSGRRNRGVGILDAGRRFASEELRRSLWSRPVRALATLGIAVYRHGTDYAAQQSWAMIQRGGLSAPPAWSGGCLA